MSEACVVPAYLPIFQLLQLAPQVIHKNSLFYFVADHLLEAVIIFVTNFRHFVEKNRLSKGFFFEGKKAQSCNILREKSGTCDI